MSTLFQIHATLDTLQPAIKDMASLWQSGDSILLLGECVSYLNWLCAYIDEVNADQEVMGSITDIQMIYMLNDDLNTLNDSIKTNLDLSITNPASIKVINDTAWVTLTQQVKRVITINH